MSIALPKPVADYFAAESRNDAEALARCFADDGVVKDEGQTIKGFAAIKRWIAEAKRKYHHSVQPLEAKDRDGKTVVIGRVSGDFPGSPVNLQHIFAISAGKITSLEIR